MESVNKITPTLNIDTCPVRKSNSVPENGRCYIDLSFEETINLLTHKKKDSDDTDED